MNKKHGSGRTIAWLSMSIITVILLISATVYALFSDIVRFQSAQRARVSGDMLKKHTQQMYSDIKETFDQMILSVPLGRLMNYSSCEAADLLVGLRQLDSIRKNIAAIDSIYLYNAENSRFYISSSHSLQAVQEFDMMFDAGAREIILNLRSYENMKPIVRTEVFTYPSYENTEYVSYVRYNTLMKGATNVYIINVRAETFFDYAQTWPKTELDAILFTDTQGNILISDSSAEHLEALSERVSRENDSKGTVFLKDGSLLNYDKTFPCGWVFIYRMLPDNAADIVTSGGAIRIIILALLISVLILMLIISYRKWLLVIKQKNREEKAMEEERETIRAIQRRHEILRAVSGDGTRAPGENKIARLWILQGISDKESIMARIRRFLDDTPVFMEEDERGRLIVCAAAQEESVLAQKLNDICAGIENGNSKPFIVVSEEFEYPHALSESYRWCEEMLCYAPLSTDECVFTPTSAKRRENAVFDIRPVSEAFSQCMAKLDGEGACSVLKEAVGRLSGCTISVYQTGLIRLALLVSDSLSQTEKQYGIRAADNCGILTDLTPVSAVRSMTESVLRAVQDALDKRSARYDGLTREINRFIHENACDSNFTIDTVAEKFDLSGAYLSRLYKKQTGAGIAESILAARIQKAKTALETGNEPVAEIAANAGFTDTQYFYRVFKKAVGATPGQYRRVYGQNTEITQGETEHDE